MDYEDLVLETPDGVKLRAYLLLLQDTPGPVVILLHANAGNMVSWKLGRGEMMRIRTTYVEAS